MYEFEYSLNQNDFKVFIIHVSKQVEKASSSKYSVLISLVLWMFVTFTLLFVFSKLSPENGSNGCAPFIAGTFVVAVITSFLYIRYLGQKQIKTMLPALDGLVLGNRKIQFSEIGYHEVGEFFEQKISHKLITKVELTNGYVYVYFDTTVACIIPIRVVKSNIDEFIAHFDKSIVRKIS